VSFREINWREKDETCKALSKFVYVSSLSYRSKYWQEFLCGDGPTAILKLERKVWNHYSLWLWKMWNWVRAQRDWHFYLGPDRDLVKTLGLVWYRDWKWFRNFSGLNIFPTKTMHAYLFSMVPPPEGSRVLRPAQGPWWQPKGWSAKCGGLRAVIMARGRAVKPRSPR
jgi:hypothetical protein